MEPYIQYILIAEYSTLYACMITLLHRYLIIPLPPIKQVKKAWVRPNSVMHMPKQTLLKLLMGAIVIAISLTLLYVIKPKYPIDIEAGLLFSMLLPYKIRLLTYWFALLLGTFFLIKTIDIWRYTNTRRRMPSGIRYIITPVLTLLSGCTIIVTLIGSEQLNQEIATKARTAIFIVVIVALITDFTLRKITHWKKSAN